MPRFGSEEHGGRGEAGDGAQGPPHARGLSCQVLAGEPAGRGCRRPRSHGCSTLSPGGFCPRSACDAGRQSLPKGPQCWDGVGGGGPPLSSGARPSTLDLKGHQA